MALDRAPVETEDYYSLLMAPAHVRPDAIMFSASLLHEISLGMVPA